MTILLPTNLNKHNKTLELSITLDLYSSHMKYNAFISHSHSHDGIAIDLLSSLQSVAKPWYKRRARRIFLDKSSLAAGPKLWSALQESLEESDFLILVASKNAAKSEWVKREIECWLNKKSADTILLALENGEILWDSKKKDFDWDKSTAIPRCLSGVFEEEPLYVDLSSIDRIDGKRNNNPQFINAVCELAAAIHGTTKDEIYSEHLHQHQKMLRLAWTVASGILLLAIALTFAVYNAIQQQNETDFQTSLSNSRELAAHSQVTLNEDRRLSFELAIQASDTSNTSESFNALMRLLQTSTGMHALIPAALNIVDYKIPNLLFLPDGRLLWTEKKQLFMWNLNCQSVPVVIWTFELEAKKLRLIANGKRLLALAGGKFELLDIENLQTISKELASRAGALSAVAVSEDSSRFALANGFNTVSVWNALNGKVEFVLKGHLGPVKQLVFSLDGDALIVADEAMQRQIRLWDLTETPPTFTKLDSLQETVGGVAFDAIRKRILVGAERFLIFDISHPEKPELTQDLTLTASVTALAIQKDHVITGHKNGTVIIWKNDATGMLVKTKTFKYDASITQLVSIQDKGLILVVSGAKWQLLQIGRTQVFQNKISSSRQQIKQAVISHDNSHIATVSSSGQVTVWNIPIQYVLGNKMAYIRDGRGLVSGLLEQVRLWKSTATQPIILNAHLEPVKSVAISPDAHWAASGGLDRALRLWNIKDEITGEWLQGKPVKKTSADYNNPGIEDIAFSPDGKYLAWAYNQESRNDGVWAGFLRVWDLDQHQLVAQLDEHPHFISTISFGAKSHSLIFGGFAKDIAIWNFQMNQKLQYLTGHKQWINDISVSSSGAKMVSASDDGTLRLWNLQDKKIHSVLLTGHTSSAHSIDFNYNDTLIASGDSAGDVFIWRINGNNARHIGTTHFPSAILQVAFTPDKSNLAVIRDPGFFELIPVNEDTMKNKIRKILECGQGSARLSVSR